ncbi:MAG: molecular chaperone HtpG [Flavobacteriales bacterium]|nr:molecular chaperone HtpG [Flavobacteriales bacterium]
MAKGNINVQAENIFPIIKKFLYSDQEIFLRELVANAIDATQKLKTLSSIDKIKGDIGELRVEVVLDEKAKTITIKDNGLGMSADEVDKYINEIAFSGAEEFVKKFKDKGDGANIIGHFGLGFYSAFMVAEKVEIITKSYKKTVKAAHWTCDGSPNYEMVEHDRKDRGTDIILHVNEEDSIEFLDKNRIQGLLSKYCKFLPVDIKFGTNEETKKTGEGDDAKEETIVTDNIINNPKPAWTQTPSKLTDVDYRSFYHELYPSNFEEPLFHIHLNVDFPFNLTGILYFPKLNNSMEVQKDKIQLYCNQVFVTDSVEGIVPDFLMLLHGVLDSPDIPLNVSRSYLQSDASVKKISNHITKKVADKLESLFKKDRKDFESKWDDIKVFIEYGMLSEEKFNDKASKFCLFKNTAGEYHTMEEYLKKITPNQTDKDKKVVCLYTSNVDEQYSYIESAKAKGYDVLVMDSPLTSHLLSKLESNNADTTFVRVDSDTVEKLIKKDEEVPSKLSEKDEEKLKPIIEEVVPKEKFTVSFESMSEKEQPFIITEPEFMRRMKEQQKMGGGGMMMMGAMPEMYNLVINSNHEIVGKMLKEKDSKKQKALIKQTSDLAMLSQNLLKGEALNSFIKRSLDMIK